MQRGGARLRTNNGRGFPGGRDCIGARRGIPFTQDGVIHGRIAQAPSGGCRSGRVSASNRARSKGRIGSKSMKALTAGGTATITCFALKVPLSLTTRQVLPCCSMRRTGALSTTRLPSRLAIRIEISWEPPTKRDSWAPSVWSRSGG